MSSSIGFKQTVNTIIAIWKFKESEFLVLSFDKFNLKSIHKFVWPLRKLILTTLSDAICWNKERV
jgi:hypothetical protein